jgi:hypothetical protein
MSVVSNNGAGADLSVKLNRLEDKVAKLTDQINANKQTINELNVFISQRDAQINALELKLGYAQQSLLEKAAHKIQECRVQIKTGMDEKVINPTLSQIQQHIKTAQEFVDEAKSILLQKKTLVDNTILTTKDKVVQCPEQAKVYVEKAIIAPTQAIINQTLGSISSQAKTTRNLVEDKAVYPGKVMFDELVTTAQNLPDKVMAVFKSELIDPLNKANGKATSVVKTIYPDTLNKLNNITGCMGDIVNQALAEIVDVVKKSPFWDGKNKLKTTS